MHDRGRNLIKRTIFNAIFQFSCSENNWRHGDTGDTIPFIWEIIVLIKITRVSFYGTILC